MTIREKCLQLRFVLLANFTPKAEIASWMPKHVWIVQSNRYIQRRRSDFHNILIHKSCSHLCQAPASDDAHITIQEYHLVKLLIPGDEQRIQSFQHGASQPAYSIVSGTGMWGMALVNQNFPFFVQWCLCVIASARSLRSWKTRHKFWCSSLICCTAHSFRT